MSRLRIVHRTGFRYADPATASYNEARMLPRSRDGQFVLQAALEISPTATQHSYPDYWGTRVSTFEVLTPHRMLTVTATSVVDVRPAQPDGPPIGWDELSARISLSLELAECVVQTPATDADEEMVGIAQRIVAGGAGIDEIALRICREVGEAMEYRSGVTGVGSTARDAWPTRSGVCQDIAHVTLGMLRAAGIPARYVSGYLHPDPTAALGQPVTGESHAWVEWYSGAWHGYDPTNLVEIGESHVYIGHGRDYTDVAPLRGVYAGPSASELFVTVEVTRLE
ncbi:transglutaminase family protein [Microbacterium sp. GCS4]|uniref:transglutaminase family protein n=1 Tax=Microbacterium sp. GCS4 TaxID=1692239 RepID=UPI000680D561|nr:transglutaminase family protein [Microbacterium sp. GCS4]KNY07624.1 transglutaminase [Microbacterium sp. GCS4]